MDFITVIVNKFSAVIWSPLLCWSYDLMTVQKCMYVCMYYYYYYYYYYHTVLFYTWKPVCMKQ